MKRTDPVQPEPTEDRLVAEDLIEEVSIDGMCGVY
jgi:mycofactocin precursor